MDEICAVSLARTNWAGTYHDVYHTAVWCLSHKRRRVETEVFVALRSLSLMSTNRLVLRAVHQWDKVVELLAVSQASSGQSHPD